MTFVLRFGDMPLASAVMPQYYSPNTNPKFFSTQG
jgi:hypothetical protein